LTDPNILAPDGKIKRMHRAVLNTARCMTFNSDIPIRFWGDAVKFAAYDFNRSPRRSNPGRKSPIEVLKGKPLSLHNILAFDFAYRDSNERNFKKCVTCGIILGIPGENKVHVVYLRRTTKMLSSLNTGSILKFSQVHKTYRSLPHLQAMKNSLIGLCNGSRRK
jgi:hypothetical protein